MLLPHYDLRSTADRLQFRFTSTGPKGSIEKVIEFSYLDELAVWNLGFGDYDAVTGRVDDQVVSDNNDGRKVLTTVAFAVREFFSVRSDATIFFTGSTSQRTRVYGWALSAYLDELSGDFIIDMITEEGTVVPFSPSVNQVIGFLIKLR